MPRFVILQHDHPFVHWDLMLEAGEVLRTWRLAAPPLSGTEPIAATPLGDHRKLYLDYEGPVSGGRGEVTRWDAGWYQELAGEVRSGRSVRVHLQGKRVVGPALLEPGPEEGWTFRFTAEGDQGTTQD
jgi:hypothetical protein